MADNKDSDLQFPDVSPIDHAKCCPKYTNVINRNKEDGIALDELDSLQMELEQLLASASQRMRQMKKEIDLLSDSQDVIKKEKKISKGKDVDHKRSKNPDERPSKKMKLADSGRHSPQVARTSISHLNSSSTSSPSGGRSKAKSASRNVEVEQVEEQPPVQRTTEIPSKFWQMMENYCGPVPQETVALLEKMEKPLSEEYFETPALGKSFSLVWAEEELAHEEKEGQRVSDNPSDKSSVEKMLKKAFGSLDDAEPCPYGSLTQRLISAFVQENIIAPPENNSGSDEKSTSHASDTDQSAVSKVSKAASAPHTTKLENRIRAELIEQGILEASEQDKDDDEVLTELKRCQQELRAVNSRNREVVSQLLKLVKLDQEKDEVRKKIEIANKELMEQYQKISSARQKKRNLMKKEKDAAMKALKDRDALVKQLEQIG